MPNPKSFALALAKLQARIDTIEKERTAKIAAVNRQYDSRVKAIAHQLDSIKSDWREYNRHLAEWNDTFKPQASTPKDQAQRIKAARKRQLKAVAKWTTEVAELKAGKENGNG